MSKIDDDAVATAIGLAIATARDDTEAYATLVAPLLLDDPDVDPADVIDAFAVLLAALADRLGGTQVIPGLAERVLAAMSITFAWRRS